MSEGPAESQQTGLERGARLLAQPGAAHRLRGQRLHRRKGVLDPVVQFVHQPDLAGEPAYPVARRLATAAVPFVFATGYGATGIHEDWAGRPVIQKPFQCEMLGLALASALRAKKRADFNR